MHFDCLNYIGELDALPVCVLLHLYKTLCKVNMKVEEYHDALREKIISRLKQIESLEVDLTNDQDLRRLATLLNPEVRSWDRRSVTEAATFLHKRMNKPLERKHIIKYPLQEPTPKQHKTIGLLLAYKYCKDLGLEVNNDIKPEGIWNMCRLHAMNKHTLISALTSLPFNDIISLFIQHRLEGIPHTSGERLLQWALILRHNKDQGNEMPLIPDREREYYIAWAALNLDLNLYDYIHPYDALLHYPNCQKFEMHSVPRENFMLRYNFDTRLPPECYKANTIKDLLNKEGLEIPAGLQLRKTTERRLVYEAIKRGYESLLNVRKLNTFYRGKHNPINTETPIGYSDINDILDIDCIAYGTYNACIVTTVTELCDHFMNYSDFIDFDLNPIPNHAIKKLHNLCHELRDLSDYQTLLQCMDAISEKLATLDEEERQWIRTFKTSMYQDVIREALNKVMKAGMFMRGWDGTTPNTYPLTGNTPLRDEIISAFVSLAMVELDEYLEAQSHIKDMIMNLKTRAADNVGGKFHWRRSTSDNITLADRFRLINKNDLTDVNTCIRTSSNYIVGTAYYYGNLIGMSFGFDIHDMRYIL